MARLIRQSVRASKALAVGFRTVISQNPEPDSMLIVLNGLENAPDGTQRYIFHVNLTFAEVDRLASIVKFAREGK